MRRRFGGSPWWLKTVWVLLLGLLALGVVGRRLGIANRRSLPRAQAHAAGPAAH
jgi:hypothetical protein